VPDAPIAMAMLPQRSWNTLLVDHALGLAACRTLAQAADAVPRRIALITPAERRELPALKAAGFTGYLVKPVRAASLAARLGSEPDGFEHGRDGAEQAPARPASAPPGLTILLAEDNEINALLARALLVKLGHRPAVAPNGAAAVAAFLAARGAGAPYDLVLMDVHMPESDGIAATRRIRAAEAGGQRTPIIALTADALSEDRDACLAAGMDDFLTKPLDRERLAAVLAACRSRPIAA
jgi:CheY-like chemotaxis protein